MAVSDRGQGLPETSIVYRGTRHAVESTQEVCADMLVHEHFLTLTVNGNEVARLSCTPRHLREMALGRLCTEGIIRSAGEVSHIGISPGADRVAVTLTGEMPPRCRMSKLPQAAVDNAVVFELARRFREDSEIHRRTSGTHSCYLHLPDGEIVGYEDISRHNALDKVVGHMLLAGADPAECVIYTTGRVPADMVQKVVMARVPMLVSKAVPTDAGVKLAKEYGLQLLCKAWPDSYVIYRGEE